MCWGGRTVVQAELYMYLPTGGGGCLVAVELSLFA